MKNNVFILNGFRRSGKDTVAKIVAESHETKLYSTVDTVKEIYCICGYQAERLPGVQGWKENKTPEDRKRMSDLKDYLTRRFDIPFKETCELIEKQISNPDPDSYLFLMIREPEEIQRIKEAYPFVKAVFVDAKERLGTIENSNHADANVEQYQYDIIIDNNGTLDDLKKEVEEKIIKSQKTLLIIKFMFNDGVEVYEMYQVVIQGTPDVDEIEDCFSSFIDSQTDYQNAEAVTVVINSFGYKWHYYTEGEDFDAVRTIKI